MGKKKKQHSRCRSAAKALSLVAGILFLVLAARLALFGVNKVENALYPRKYSQYVEYYAGKYEMDPLLVYAIIRTESGFDPDAHSNADALGLMQITETAFHWLRAKIAPGEELTFESLYDPETNIRFGCYYWACCLERYGNDVSTAAASYFSGWTTVDTLLQSEEYSSDGITLHTFPYDGMEQYVEKIQKNYQAYQKLYSETEG